MADVDLFIQNLPSNLKHIAIGLQHLILSSSPAIEERYSYKVPFYYYMGPLCYMNKIKNAIYLGFVKGDQLLDEYHILEQGNRKQVRIIRVWSLDERTGNELKFYINQAMILNEILRKEK